MHSRPRRSLAAGLLVTALGVAACTDDADDRAGDGSAAPTAGGSAAPGASTTAGPLVSAAPGTSPPAPATAPTAPPTQPPSTPVPTGPLDASGTACADFPPDGAGSLAAMAGLPAASAIAATPLLSTLATAIQGAELAGDLDGAGPFTVFAPLNGAFDALPPAERDEILADPRGALTEVLSLHVANGERLNSRQLVAAGGVESRAGRLAITPSAETLLVDAGGGTATVVCADVQTANATLHLVDTVLLPPPVDTAAVAGSVLYSVDLATGAAASRGPIGQELGVVGLAATAGGDELLGLTDVPSLITFSPADPATIVAEVPITGVAEGSSLLALDVAPGSGDVVAVTDAGTPYTIDAATGAATATGSAVEPPPTDPGLGVDVDPATGRVRIVDAAGQHLVADVAGGAADTRPAPSYGADDANAAVTPRVVAVAFGPPTAGGPAAGLFAVDAAAAVLARLDPGDAATLATIGPLGVTLTDGASLDITVAGAAYMSVPG